MSEQRPTERATPETNANEYDSTGGLTRPEMVVESRFARTLERQRDEAREDAARWKHLWETGYVNERNELREQRDALLAAAKKAVNDWYPGHGPSYATIKNLEDAITNATPTVKEDAP